MLTAGEDEVWGGGGGRCRALESLFLHAFPFKGVASRPSCGRLSWEVGIPPPPPPLL